MPMKGLRRNDDAMKNYRWYQKIITSPIKNFTKANKVAA